MDNRRAPRQGHSISADPGRSPRRRADLLIASVAAAIFALVAALYVVNAAFPSDGRCTGPEYEVFERLPRLRNQTLEPGSHEQGEASLFFNAFGG